MVMALGDGDAREQQVCDRTMRKQWAFVNIGATGAPTISTDQSSSGFGISRAGTGEYDLTFKPCRFGLHPKVVLKSAAKTVVGYVVTAYDAQAGTATIKTLAGTNAAADTDPANGDAMTIEIDGMPYSVG